MQNYMSGYKERSEFGQEYDLQGQPRIPVAFSLHLPHTDMTSHGSRAVDLQIFSPLLTSLRAGTILCTNIPLFLLAHCLKDIRRINE